MKKTIVAIGGGEISTEETKAIDEYIIAATNADHPNVLFIPTASSDSSGYAATFTSYYESLGARVRVLNLIDTKAPRDAIRSEILSSDAIYVGGGNTAMMLEVWKQHGVDDALKEAYEEGIVLSGLSAGSICWMNWGHSDSNSFDAKDDVWSWSKVYGMGMIPLGCVPHYDEPGRHTFDEMFAMADEHVGLALGNGAAAVFTNNTMRILYAMPNAKAYRFLKTPEGVSKTVLTDNTDYSIT